MTDQQIMSEAVARGQEIIRLRDLNGELRAALERCAVRLAAMGHSEECRETPHGPCVCGNTQAMEQARAAIAKVQS